jgi:hypothetical protein
MNDESILQYSAEHFSETGCVNYLHVKGCKAPTLGSIKKT